MITTLLTKPSKFLSFQKKHTTDNVKPLNINLILVSTTRGPVVKKYFTMFEAFERCSRFVFYALTTPSYATVVFS